MNIKKLVVNSLAVVGAIVVIDKVVNAICEKSTKIISEDMLDDDCCSCDHDEDIEESNEDEDNVSFPDIEKYDDPSSEDGQTFEYSVKTENITSKPSEV